MLRSLSPVSWFSGASTATHKQEQCPLTAVLLEAAIAGTFPIGGWKWYQAGSGGALEGFLGPFLSTKHSLSYPGDPVIPVGWRQGRSWLRTALPSVCSSKTLHGSTSGDQLSCCFGEIFSMHCSSWHLLLAFQEQSNKINAPSPCTTHRLLASLCCNISPNPQPASRCL